MAFMCPLKSEHEQNIKTLSQLKKVLKILEKEMEAKIQIPSDPNCNSCCKPESPPCCGSSCQQCLPPCPPPSQEELVPPDIMVNF